jgi:cytochrome d ubiquinol oxidase subunit II
LCLKTTGVLRERSARLARRVAPLTAVAVIGFVIWTHVIASSAFFLNVIELLAILAVLAAAWLAYAHRDGFAFAATTVTIASCIITLFTDLYPNVMVSSTSSAYNLTARGTASNHYSLTAMTVVLLIFLPLVLAYQTWTYYVFRRRISRDEFAAGPAPAVPAQPAGPADDDRPARAARPSSHRRT